MGVIRFVDMVYRNNVTYFGWIASIIAYVQHTQVREELSDGI
jgi:hypothetical protein